MKIYCGIDPGKTGSAAFLHGREVWFRDTSEIGATDFEWIEMFICVEKAQAMPKQGVVSMFNYGVEYGKIIGILKALNKSFAEIRPILWKKEFSLIHQPKERSIDIAKQLFPQIGDQLKLKKHHHRADALLLCEYGRRKNM